MTNNQNILREKIINLVGSDDYKYTFDELEMIIIKNKLDARFEFRPEEIKSIEIVEDINSN